MKVLSSLELVDFLTFFPSGCPLILARFALRKLFPSSPLPPFSCSLSHDAAGDQIFDLNFALEAEGEDDVDEDEALAAAAATTSEFMREVKGVAVAALGDEGWRMGKAGRTGEESSLRTHRSSGESGEFPSDDGDDEDMARTAWNLSICY